MKRLSIILLSIFAAFTMNAQNIELQAKNKGITLSNDKFSGFDAAFSYNLIESATISETEKGAFSAISIAGAYQSGNIGTPELPVFKKMIAIPVGAAPKIAVKNYTAAEYNLEDYGIKTIYPKQPRVRKNQNPNEVPFAYDERAYSKSEYGRFEMAEVEILGTMRGVIVGMVTVRPLQYNPVANTIRAYNDIEIEVTFENGDFEETQKLYSNTKNPYFENVYKTPFNRGVYEDRPDLYTTPVRMLVIANRMFEQTLQPWLEWKTQKGFYLDVNYTDAIGTSAAAIKTFIHNKYNQGIGNGTAPTFIVIVGDTPQVPASGNGLANDGGSDGHKATDLYYATVDGDYLPEMYYSRMSAQNTTQLANIIEKILYYEKYEFESPSYLDNALLIAGADSYWAARVGRPAINYAADNYFNTANGYANVYKYVTSSYTGCYTNLNNVGFANYTAHGEETGWSDPSYSSSNVSSLTNLNKYFVAMGNCCLAADFGYTGNGGECFGETMIRAQKKGAVGYIGSSPVSFWDDDFHFAVGAYSGSIGTNTNPTLQNTTDGCYDLMFRDANFNTLCSYVFAGNLAVTHACTNSGYVTDSSPLYYWEAYNVLGDGSLMPYHTQGSVNNVSHLPVLYIGVNNYVVNAEPNSYVAISQNGVLCGTAVADASGVANVTLSPPITSADNVDIVVTRNQYIPYIAQVPAAAMVGAYIVANGYEVVNEDVLTYISQNKNIAVTLKNVGADPTAGTLNVAISCDDPQLTINNATAQCGIINADGTAIVNFNVSVANNIPDNKIFPVKVTITDIDNTTWENNILLNAYAPKFSLEKIFVDNVENGNLEPNSIKTITAVIKNTGNADAYNVAGNLQINSPYITFACGQTNAIQNLPAGASMNLDFVVITAEIENQSNFDLSLTAQYGLSHNVPFEVQKASSSSSNFCIPESDCSDGDKFTSVKLLKTSDQYVLIDNANTTCASNGYSDFTNTTAVLTAGEQYTIKVKVGYNSNKVRGWLDYNNNGAFDSNEQIVNFTCSNSGTEYSGNFTIPANTAYGEYRLRLRTKYASGWYDTSAPNACDALSYGQTHDYTIIIPNNFARVANVVATENSNSITITWDAPTADTPIGYNIYRGGNRLNSTPLTQTNYTENNLTEEVYVYNVTAIYAGNNESLSEMSNVVCISELISCEQPTNFAATSAGKTATLTWNEPENIDGVLLMYNIYKNGIKIDDVAENVFEYNDENLENGTYLYQVSAVYSHCEALTDAVSVEINVLPDFCEQPTNFAATYNEKTAVLTWNEPENIDGVLLRYNIYRNTEQIDYVAPNIFQYNDENLENGTYLYQVSAVYSHCEALTDAVSVEINVLPDFCEQPTNFAVTFNETTAILTWNEPENIDGVLLMYNIYRNTEQIADVAPNIFEYNDENLENGTYLYQVSAAYSHCEALTDAVFVEINYSGINNLQETSYIIYPNPANNEVTIQGDGLSRAKIYDLQGRIVGAYCIRPNETINISALSSGVYLVKMYSETNKAEVKRLIVIK